MDFDQLLARLAVPHYWRAGLLLLDRDGALRVLEALKLNGGRVLGVDGFIDSGPNQIEPDMGAICDLSDETDLDEAIRSAEDFISSLPADHLIELTVD